MPAACLNNPQNDTADDQDDEPSRHGRYSWALVGNTCIPCLLKKDGSRYVSVRMAEMKVLNSYLNSFNTEMLTCVSVTSFRITKAETALLNAINNEHCERTFGSTEFHKDRDFIVKLEDLIEYRNFMETCFNKLRRSSSEPRTSRCGFIRINNESVVPFTTTAKNNIKYLPLFYFEGETDHLRNNAIFVDGWDLAYLKFCCKVQGIRNELFSNDRCEMISLDDIRSYFPEGTIFEDYWPPHAVNNARGNNHPNGMLSWVQSPLHSPAPSSVPVSMQSMNGMQPAPSLQQQQQQQQQQRNPRRPITTTAMNGGTHTGLLPTYAAKTVWPPSNNAGTMMSDTGRHRLPVQNVSQTVMQNVASKQNAYLGNATMVTPRMYQAPNTRNVYYNMPVASANGTVHQRAATSSLPNSYPNTMPNYSHPNRQPVVQQQQQQQHHRIDNILSSQQQRLQQMNGHHNPVSAANNNAVSVTRPAFVNGTRHPTAVVNSSQASSVAARSNNRPGVTQSDEVIDLLSPPSSPRSRRTGMPSLSPISKTTASVGKPSRPLPPLVPIDEMATPVQRTLFPYTTQVVKYGDASIFTINLKPYAFKELLVPLSDIAGKIFHTDVADLRCKLQQGLKIQLYKPNTMQLQILKDNNKCRSGDEDVPLILFTDFDSHYNHLVFLHQNHEAKRARRS